ncbi:putative AB5 enterotoxin ADP-ribosylating subunit YtxA [Yersinia kristensenii]|uniref:putative AB5 enterotoxin ADP-ribosylating subunit YtxA n=1 Tax=Yersinia kristensenii TaxID=28152 RepID=UPI001E37F0D8|nr:putative AB5 enterotoxin ADP-ribosylating subunit YtxA [Yersinia kristensenii]MDA5475081.1 putative AB5 enterotoxin ADP-ribosylating subunit YtxA [Yersinia kristensenii]MDA5477287.1 putative AB5 enterotoxin ADP-ribosylating subunit YtxA [Yersinia kristensenii]MDA5505467.1 putative AB5 enterotoxin ADP-ribosylating subunit YtxA [Yersinia kristensenii]
MVILIKIILLYFISILLTYKCEAKPPDIVWRVDTRNYSEIFNNGFYSAGTNDDIIEHLSGRSCRSAESDYGDSAFISTTSNRQFAYEYAERVLRHMDERGEANAQVNIYQMRATDNMYSAEQTLDFFLLRYGHESHSEVLRIARFSSHLSEWIAHRRIEADQIATVTQYYLLRGNVHSNGQLPNPRFRQTRSSASHRPYDSAYFTRPNLRLARMWLIINGIRPMVSACFGVELEHTEFKRALALDNIKTKEMFKLIVIL